MTADLTAGMMPRSARAAAAYPDLRPTEGTRLLAATTTPTTEH